MRSTTCKWGESRLAAVQFCEVYKNLCSCHLQWCDSEFSPGWSQFSPGWRLWAQGPGPRAVVLGDLFPELPCPSCPILSILVLNHVESEWKENNQKTKSWTAKCLLRSSVKMPLLNFLEGVTGSSRTPFQAWVISAIFRLLLFIPFHSSWASRKHLYCPVFPQFYRRKCLSWASFFEVFSFFWDYL